MQGTFNFEPQKSSRPSRRSNISQEDQLEDEVAPLVEEDPPSIYIRNYETSKDRSNRLELLHKANILNKMSYDPKKIITNGSNLRTKILSKEKHMPLKLADVNEPVRIKNGIEDRCNVSLRESFNMELYKNPVWKSVEK